MYNEFKNVDLELMQIALNAAKFGVDNLTNKELLSHFFRNCDLQISKENTIAIKNIFYALDGIKTKNQLSQD